MKIYPTCIILRNAKTLLVCSLLAGSLVACDSDDKVDKEANALVAALNDIDSDGIQNESDNCAIVANPDQRDTDNDNIGDACDSQNDLLEPDADADTISDDIDNCPAISNTDQADADNDNIGDLCDDTDDSIVLIDGDGDGVSDDSDNCPAVSNANQLDTDGDNVGDLCDDTDDSIVDSDGDGVADDDDNCPAISNSDQDDKDDDNLGDACDTVDDRQPVDTDGDGLSDDEETNLGLDPLNSDTDADGVADGTDKFPNDPLASLDSDDDGVSDERDQFPNDPTETSDLNGDGLGDNANPFEGTVITGEVLEADAETPVAGAKVSLELVNTSNGTNPVVLTETNILGGFALVAADNLIPDTFVIVITAEGFEPIAIPLANATDTVDAGDIALIDISNDFVSLETLPSVHHLGDDSFSGSANSQFQRSTEGSQLTRSFNLSKEQAESEQLELNWVAKGIQLANTISINGTVVTTTPVTNVDGSYTLQSIPLDTDDGILLEGANTLVIESAQTPFSTDLDDFEFVFIGISDRN